MIQKREAILLGLGGLALLGVVLGFLVWGLAAGSGDEIRTLKWDSIDRIYRLHKPANLDASRSPPLVLVLHGGGSNGWQTEVLTKDGWNELADREGFIVAYPDGVGSRWNDGRTDPSIPAQRSAVDDVGFLKALVERLASEFNVSRGRVFATGISNGAMMSYRLACDASGTFAAVGPVAGAMPEALVPSCVPVRPVSVVAFNGIQDPLVPWAGGEVTIGRQRFGRVLSTTDSVRLWVGKDQCPSPPSTTREPDRDPGDGTEVDRQAWGACHQGTEVVLYTILGGGHTWPGGVQYLPDFLIGRTSRDIDATQLIWEFFRGHGRS